MIKKWQKSVFEKILDFDTKCFLKVDIWKCITELKKESVVFFENRPFVSILGVLNMHNNAQIIITSVIYGFNPNL